MIAPKNNEKEGKLRPHLLPFDLLMELLCPAYEEGLLKYFKESWRMGFLHSVMYDACQRHLKAFYFDKEDYDQETWEKYGIKKLHLGAAIFCLISMYITQKLHPHLDDRGMDMVAYEQHLEKAKKENTLSNYELSREQREEYEKLKSDGVVTSSEDYIRWRGTMEDYLHERTVSRNKVVASKWAGSIKAGVVKVQAVLARFF